MFKPGEILNKNAIHTPFGDMVHKWRVENQLSYNKAAKLLDVAPNSLVAYETKGKIPSIRIERKIKNAIVGRQELCDTREILLDLYEILGQITASEKSIENVGDDITQDEYQKCLIINETRYIEQVIDLRLLPGLKKYKGALREREKSVLPED